MKFLNEETQDYTNMRQQIIDSNYFNDNRPIKEDIYRKRNAFPSLSGDANHKVLQGGCYVSSTGHFVMAINNKENDSSIVVELDNDYKTVIKRKQIDLGHANDFTYNPQNDKIYVATGDTGTRANKIAVLNAKTLALETTLTLDGSVKWLCSYDEVNDKYYTIGGGYIRVFDGAWNQIKAISNTLARNYKGKGKITFQSSFCYEGKFITLSFSNEVAANALQISGIFLSVINMETGGIESVAKYTPCDNSDEPEFIAVIGDVAYMFGGQLYFQVSKLYLDQTALREAETDIFGAAKLIPQGTDLNNCLIPGMFYSPNTAYTTGIANAPVSNGFTLYVLPVGRGVLVQELINSNGDIYKRLFGVSSGEFAEWKMIDSCVGRRYTRSNDATTQKVAMNDNGACFVVLGTGSQANFYFISSVNGIAYVKKFFTPISDVTITKSGLNVTFSRSGGITMFIWKMA